MTLINILLNITYFREKSNGWKPINYIKSFGLFELLWIAKIHFVIAVAFFETNN